MRHRSAATAVIALTAAQAFAQPFTFQYAIGTVNPVGNTIPAISRSPAFEGGTLAFVGIPVGSPVEGIYTLPLGGAISVVARREDPAPGGGTFNQLANTPSISHGVVAFHGFTSLGRGIYTNLGGTLTNVAGPGLTPLPGATPPGTRWGFRPATDGQTVVFTGTTQATPTSDAYGVYSWTPAGGRRVVVDLATPNPSNPGGHLGPYTNMPAISGGLVTVMGPGVHIANLSGQVVQTVASHGMPVPGTPGTFNSFSHNSLAISGSAVLFHGSGTSGTGGLYTNLGGSLRRVADTNTPIPGGTGNFTGFDNSASAYGIRGSNIVFTGVGTGDQMGLFGDFGHGLERIIAVGDSLDGRVLTDFWFDREGLDGNRFAFTGTFNDGTVAIYVVSVPAPSAALPLALVAGLALRSRR
jgi:hypothetical protein